MLKGWILSHKSARRSEKHIMHFAYCVVPPPQKKKKTIKCYCKQNQSDYKIKAEEAILFKVLNFYIREGERFELIAISVVEFVLILHPVKPECMKES